jgi:hypothetical protein
MDKVSGGFEFQVMACFALIVQGLVACPKSCHCEESRRWRNDEVISRMNHTPQSDIRPEGLSPREDCGYHPAFSVLRTGHNKNADAPPISS